MGDVEILIPLLAIGLTFGTPIIWMLLSHQRKMAEMIHGQSKQASMAQMPSQEVQALRAELAEVRDLSRQQMILLDSMRNELQELKARPSLEPLTKELQ